MDERAQSYLILALNAAMVFVVVSAVFTLEWHLISFEPFSHDEAVYLTKARSWLIGTPADQWGIYRPLGLSVIAWVLLHFGHSEVYVRSFGILCGMATLAIYFIFTRKLSNLWVAITAAFVLGGSLLFMQQVPLFLDDVMAAGFLIGMMWCIWEYYRSAGSSDAIYFAAPFAAAAFYLRYGSVSPLLVIAIATAVLLAPIFLRNETAQYDKFAKTIFLAIALFAPHLIFSLMKTDSIFGILQMAGDAAHREYIGGGLIQYIKWLPSELGGLPLDLCAVLGALATVAFFSIKRLRERHLGLIWAGSIGIGSFILTGLLVHAEQRYVIFPLMLLSSVGISAVYLLVSRVSSIAAVILMALVCIAAISFGVGYFKYLNSFYESRENSTLSKQYSQAHEAIARTDSGKPCAVWEVQFQPRASWYTGCEILDLTTTVQFQKQVDAHKDYELFAVTRIKLKSAQLRPESASQYNVALSEIYRAAGPTGDDVVVYSVRTGVPATGSTTSGLPFGVLPALPV